MATSKDASAEFRVYASPKAIKDAIADLESRRRELEALVDQELELAVKAQMGPAVKYEDLAAQEGNKQILQRVRDAMLKDPAARIDERLSVLRNLLDTSSTSDQVQSLSSPASAQGAASSVDEATSLASTKTSGLS
jgi:hypothetical protein